MMKECAPLLPKEVVERAEKLGVALLLDGAKKAKIEIPNGGCMDAEVMPVDQSMHVAGTALTVETSNGDNFPIHVASYSFDAEGYVMVIDGKGIDEKYTMPTVSNIDGYRSSLHSLFTRIMSYGLELLP